MIWWVVFNVLARSARPGYPARDVGRPEVEAWGREALGLGICTVICLLADAELAEYYPALIGVGGLLGVYRSLGLGVLHFPIPDHQHPPLAAEQLGRVVAAFEHAEKPVLVHCSAGLDRTGQVAAALERLLVPGRP